MLLKNSLVITMNEEKYGSGSVKSELGIDVSDIPMQPFEPYTGKIEISEYMPLDP